VQPALPDTQGQKHSQGNAARPTPQAPQALQAPPAPPAQPAATPAAAPRPRRFEGMGGPATIDTPSHAGTSSDGVGGTGSRSASDRQINPLDTPCGAAARHAAQARHASSLDTPASLKRAMAAQTKLDAPAGAAHAEAAQPADDDLVQPAVEETAAPANTPRVQQPRALKLPSIPESGRVDNRGGAADSPPGMQQRPDNGVDHSSGHVHEPEDVHHSGSIATGQQAATAPGASGTSSLHTAPADTKAAEAPAPSEVQRSVFARNLASLAQELKQQEQSKQAAASHGASGPDHADFQRVGMRPEEQDAGQFWVGTEAGEFDADDDECLMTPPDERPAEQKW
jgi:hypothetical protein